MKTNKSINKTINFNNSLFANGFKLYKDIYQSGSVVDPSNLKALKLLFKNVGWRIVFLTRLNNKGLNKIRSLHNFGIMIFKINKNHGPLFVIKYLKAAQLAIQKKISGSPFSSLRDIEPDLPLPRLSKSGLPEFIKLEDRAAIVRGSLTVIRYWLSITSCYRVLKGPVKSKLNTITDPFVGDENSIGDFNKFISNYLLKLIANFHLYGFHPSRLRVEHLRFILKSSPSSKLSWAGILRDYNSLSIHFTSVWEAINDYVNLTHSGFMKRVFRLCSYIKAKELEVVHRVQEGQSLKEQTEIGDQISCIGQLSFKEEAAGKLRVFAMVDVITQSLLYPLHKSLFDLFKKFPNDGTHDQSKAFTRALEKSVTYNCSYGFDLSSATDRLPITIQSHILNTLTKSVLGDLWSKILVNRPYKVLSNTYGIDPRDYHYAVGQPMGALSSWAMLNFTHHLMVQYCYWRVNGRKFKGWCTLYEVLGDDIVIFDKDIAAFYLRLCNALGVSININKSIVSPNKPVVEFAKRTGLNGFDVSALSFKEFLSNNGFFGRLQMTTKLIERKWGKSLLSIFKIGNMISSNKFDLAYPVVAYLTQAVVKGKYPLTKLLTFLYDYKKSWVFWGKTNESLDLVSLKQELYNLLYPDKAKEVNPKLENFWLANRKIDNMKLSLFEKIKVIYNRVNNEAWIEEKLNSYLNLVDLGTIITYPDGTKLDRSGDENLLKAQVAFKQMLWESINVKLNFRREVFGWLGHNYQSLSLESLLDMQREYESIMSEFILTKPKDSESKLVENPLKILEFIKLSNSKVILQRKQPLSTAPSSIGWLGLDNLSKLRG